MLSGALPGVFRNLLAVGLLGQRADACAVLLDGAKVSSQGLVPAPLRRAHGARGPSSRFWHRGSEKRYLAQFLLYMYILSGIKLREGCIFFCQLSAYISSPFSYRTVDIFVRSFFIH